MPNTKSCENVIRERQNGFLLYFAVRQYSTILTVCEHLVTLLGWCTGFETTIAVFERQKAANLLKRENNVIGGNVQT